MVEVWCGEVCCVFDFELVEGYWCLSWGIVLVLGYYILYIIHIHYYILYYLILLLYLILYSSSLPLLLSFLSHISSSSSLLSPLFLFFPSFSSLPHLNHPSLIHSILVGTYIYLFIFFPIFLIPIFHSILVGTYIYLFILSHSRIIWPRTNYRRDVSSGVVLFVWCSVLVDGWGVLAFELVFWFDVRCCIILYYILYPIPILYIIYYTIYYTILLYLILYSPSPSPLLIYSSNPLPFPISSSLPLLFYSSYSHPLPNHSILVGTYMRLFIYSSDLSSFPFHLSQYPHLFLLFPIFKNNSTPHKLSEGCLEWCSFISMWFVF